MKKVVKDSNVGFFFSASHHSSFYTFLRQKKGEAMSAPPLFKLISTSTLSTLRRSLYHQG